MQGRRVLTILFTLMLFASGPLEAAIPKLPSARAFKSKKLNESKTAKQRLPRPSKYIESRAQDLYSDLMSRPPRLVPSRAVAVEAASGKVGWLGSVYSRNLIDASASTMLLADKLLMYKVLEQGLGPDKVQKYLPKTIGLKEFLDKKRLVKKTGEIKATGEKIEQALYREFPAGFVLRPAVGIAPGETSRGLFSETDNFVSELIEGKFQGYAPSNFWKPIKSHILDAIGSGEAVVLQDDLVARADAKKKLEVRAYREIRVHTYEGRIVADAVPTRWVQKAKVSNDEITRAESFVAEMLSSLPPRLISRQAWGVDVAVFDNGELAVTDIVTNRGRRIQWSSYLEQPRVIGAYSRHFETYAGIRFEGITGTLARNNLGNYFSYWDARIQKAQPGWQRLLSFLPPVP